MSNDWFRFKQFTIRQGQTAMKVGVDSVLLGAWTDPCSARRILDVGTGTGLLALMMAQRNADALIDAIEIDESAGRQASQNVADSPWPTRVRVVIADFRQFLGDGHKYDLIISNPPYFAQSTKSEDHTRRLARHNDTLSHDDLLSGASRLLLPEGRLAVALPPSESEVFARSAAAAGLTVGRRLFIHSLPNRPAHCVLTEFAHATSDTEEAALCIHQSGGTFTEAYKQLTKNFYLKF